MTETSPFGENLLSQDGELYYIPLFLKPQESQDLFQTLREKISWQEREVLIFGVKRPQPRLVAWHGDPESCYTYAGLTLQPQAWTPELNKINQSLESFLGVHFNSVLLNLYRDQSDSNGWHADDEKELGTRPIIASLSLGEARDFLVKHKVYKEKKLKLKLEEGSLLIMQGEMQTYWKHTLPKRVRPLGPRINLTFRQIRN
jgi:alkylated DNA repair dioxygenase AlkB